MGTFDHSMCIIEVILNNFAQILILKPFALHLNYWNSIYLKKSL